VSNDPWSERYRIRGKAWIDAAAAANILEETKSAVLSQMMLKLGDMPVSRAEMQVKGSADWKEFLQVMVNARKEADLLKLEVEWIKMKFNEQQSSEATRRAEMKL
jgi:hypothetical protein